MDQPKRGDAHTPRTRGRKTTYFSQETRRICRHLDKLDRLPLDCSFDFRMYFDRNEFVYTGKQRLGPGSR